MAIRRNLIACIVVLLLLSGGIIAGCLFFLSHEQDERDAYACCDASYYISRPTEASVFLINDIHHVTWDDLPLLSDSILPPPTVWYGRSVDVDKPLYVVCYPQSCAAVWCAVMPHDVTAVVRYITDTLCNGYAPIVESLEQGRMYHFATRDNCFLHLYVASGVMGCSYKERLLLPQDTDTRLGAFIGGVQRLSNVGVVYHAQDYSYNDIVIDEEGCELHLTIDDCRVEWGGEVALDTSLISHRSVMAIQAVLPHHEALSPVVTLAYIPSVADSTILRGVIAVPIEQPRAISEELLGVYTAYGYRADSAAVKRWIAPELVTADSYWLTAHDGILYASPAHDALWSYASDLHRGNHVSGFSRLSPASVTVVGDSIDIALLPELIARQLPRYIASEPIRYIRVSPGSAGCKYRIGLCRVKK